MEANKDEAARAKSIADAKLDNKNFVGAKIFALKAQTLYPGLEGISKMVMNLDVYISAEKRINGQVNWYGVLGVAPTADEGTIRKQYKKLALMFHPDKNNSAGADGAFKLISEASSLLLDKEKRSAYDLITGLKKLQEKAATTISRPNPSNVYPTRTTMPKPTGRPSRKSSEPSLTKSTKRKASAPKPQKKAAKAPRKPSPGPANQRVESFWTICGECKFRWEFHCMYRDATLICPNCKVPFLASEIPPPVSQVRSRKPRPKVSHTASAEQEQ